MSMYSMVLDHTINEKGTAEAASFQIRFPRIILPEFNTHKKFNKNTSSSRAIPIKKLIADIRKDMFMPTYWGKNMPGMSAKEELTGWRLKVAQGLWRFAGHTACTMALVAFHLGLHKQIANRLVEPFSYTTMVFTTTNLSNFIALRNHPDAQPEIQVLAKLILESIENSAPRILKYGEWHLPYIDEFERQVLSLEDAIKVSVSRCASTSYKTVDGSEMTMERALALYTRLLGSTPVHASPAEHQLTPDRTKLVDIRDHGTEEWTTKEVWEKPELHAATTGFIQYRKLLENEYVGPSIEGRLL